MVRALCACAAIVAIAVATADHARAQEPGSNDPQAGSPAGTIYQIPLDTARRDAAPRTRGGGPDPSPLRSENDFGSSAVVPGTTGGGSGSAGGGATSGGSAASGGGAGGGSGGGKAGSGGGSGGGGGSGSGGGGSGGGNAG